MSKKLLPNTPAHTKFCMIITLNVNWNFPLDYIFLLSKIIVIYYIKTLEIISFEETPIKTFHARFESEMPEAESPFLIKNKNITLKQELKNTNL